MLLNHKDKILTADQTGNSKLHKLLKHNLFHKSSSLISSLPQALGAGMLLGLSIAAPPGPVSAAIAQRIAMKRSWVPGIVVGLGAMTADAVYLLITYLGWTSVVSQNKDVTGWIYLVGSIVLFLYAALMVLRQLRGRTGNMIDERADIASKKKESSFSYIIGLTMGFSNPYQIAWWLTVGLASISYFGQTVIVGFFGGIVLWLFILCSGLHYGSSKFRNFETVVLYGSSLVLFGFAVWFLYSALLVI